MKRITAVFLAVGSLFASSGCGLEADEAIDEQGNVRKMTAQGRAALVGSDPVTNPDPDGATGTDRTGGGLLPVLPGTTTGEVVGGPVVDPTLAQGQSGGVVGLPQDPIPLVEPGKPGAGPQPEGGPRVGPTF